MRASYDTRWRGGRDIHPGSPALGAAAPHVLAEIARLHALGLPGPSVETATYDAVASWLMGHIFDRA